MNQLAAAALRYASNGWAVFPLYGIVDGRCECGTNCGSPGKHPRISTGVHGASTDERIIEAWWKRWPNANVGVATGAVSGIYVIDLDNKRSVDLGNGILVSEGQHSLDQKSLDIGRLPETLTQTTGSGGTHLVFSYPTMTGMEAASLGNRAGILSSVDTRGDGGYIVAPPSLHQSGSRYRWIEEDQPLANLPSPWIALLKTAPASKHSLDLEIPHDFAVAEGEGRHDWLFRMGAKLRGQHGLPQLALYGALEAYNRLVCKPPLEVKEVQHIVDSCLDYAPEIQLDTLDHSGTVPELHEGEDVAIHLADFLADEPKPFVPLIGKLLNSGECMILGGPPNIGKTWAVMDMMMAISSGTDFAGHFHAQQAPVLFIDEEGSRRGDWDRFQMLLAGREDMSAVEFPIYTKIDSGIRLDDARGHAALSRLIERYRPGAVFLDSLVRVHGGNESDNRGMAEFFRLVKRLMVTYGCSFVFTHHIRKPSRESVDDPIWMLRGAGDIQGFPDSILVFLPSDDTSEIKAIHTKMRNGEKHPNFALHLQIEDDRGLARVGFRDLIATANDTRDRILSILSTAGQRLSAADVAARSGLGLATVTDHMKVLEASGAIRSTREANTRYYQTGF